VERARLHAVGAEAGEASAELAGGPLRERDRQHLRRGHRAGNDAVRDSVRDGACLARAGSGEDSKRPFESERDLTLVRIEAVEEAVSLCVGHCTSMVGDR
jgi:hypothetical protein